MAFSMRIIGALFNKEVKGLAKNKNVLLMFLLPVFFAIIYSRLAASDPSAHMDIVEILLLCVGMNLILGSSFVMAMLISEEKEKNTLRTLMLSGVSPLEFLAGKVLITFLLTTLSNLAIFLIVGIDPSYLFQFILLTTLVVIAMMEIGAVLGIFSPNQMATGTIGMPVLMVFLFVPMFAPVNETVGTVAGYLPTHNLNLVLESLFSGGGLGANSTTNLAIILAWIVVAAAGFIYTYNKVGLDK